jgi:hypothetical protein
MMHWAHRTPTAWAIRQIRAHEPLFNAFDLVLRKGAALRGSLPSRSRREPAHLQPPAADEPAADEPAAERQPSDGVMTPP